MAAEDQDSRTEDPTSKRQSEAENKGNVAMSREVGFAAMLLSAVTVMLLVLPWSMAPLLRLMRGLVERPEQISLATPADIAAVAEKVAIAIAGGVGPALLLFMAAGFLSTLGQHGGLIWAVEKLAPNWGMLNPLRGFERIFSWRALIEWAKGLVKLVIVAVLAFLLLQPEFLRIETLVGLEPAAIVALLKRDTLNLLLVALVAITVIAVADVFYQRWQHWRSLKMTKQEVKDEQKNQDGDPVIKSQQRARRRQRARQRMLQAVPKASVVITNPTHYAVALQYERGMNAPKLVAKGMDFLAQRIRAVAEENDVPILENPPLARALHAAVEVDEEIPPEHYKAVAEIISYVMRMQRWKKAG